MVLKSMTGYGRGESEIRGRLWTAEVRCVNNRFLDAKIKMPRDYTVLEESIRKRIGAYHQRGRVDLSLAVTGDFSDLLDVRVDSRLARSYKDALESLADELGISCPLDAVKLAEYPDVLVREQLSEDVEAIGPAVLEAVTQALEDCNSMRLREAAALSGDLNARLQHFADTLDAIEVQIPLLLKQREEALGERLEKLLGNTGLEPMRLAQEVALLADKTDVTEEIVRLRSHIDQFHQLLEVPDAVGRKLDFLIQEFLREVNTLASKITDADIAHKTVDLKSELEKMREQVQNLE